MIYTFEGVHKLICHFKDLINALGNLANSVLALSIAIAVAIGQKAVGIISSDVALLTTAVDNV
jgi:hypothetical protein